MVKTHCDLCDGLDGKDTVVRQSRIPGKPTWDQNLLNVGVFVTANGREILQHDPLRGVRKDVCPACLSKVVADAYGLRTADELYAIRDELNLKARQLEDLVDAVRSFLNGTGTAPWCDLGLPTEHLRTVLEAVSPSDEVIPL